MRAFSSRACSNGQALATAAISATDMETTPPPRLGARTRRVKRISQLVCALLVPEVGFHHEVDELALGKRPPVVAINPVGNFEIVIRLPPPVLHRQDIVLPVHPFDRSRGHQPARLKY